MGRSGIDPTPSTVIELRDGFARADRLDLEAIIADLRAFLIGRAARRGAATLERLCTPGAMESAAATVSSPDGQLVRFPPPEPSSAAAPAAVGILCAMAARLRAEEQLVDAEFLCHQALALAGECFGERTIETAEVLRQLGAVHEAAGDAVAAEAAYERALSVVEGLRGADESVATMRRALGCVEGLRGRYAAGEAHVRRALAIRLQAVGPGHPESARDAVVLASLLMAQGDSDEAESLLRFALSVVEAADGPDSRHAAERAHDLGSCLAMQGRPAEAAACFERALLIRRAVLGPADPEVATTLHNLALAKEAAGQVDEARRLWTEAAAVIDAAVGPQG
jgi:tetratricopeptide (TPR) repeat protein